MLTYQIEEALGIVVIEPSAPLAREDFEALAQAVAAMVCFRPGTDELASLAGRIKHSNL
jgi:hypothetical protein